MVSSPDAAVRRWLFLFCGVVALLIVFGGFVRLTRSGLSIVEWDPVTGVVPPIGHDAWEDVFAEYQRSPEFHKVNSAMTLDEFRRIFLIEWFHRLIARLAGFAYALPLVYFLVRRRIPRRDLAVYVVMGSLFVLQAVAGWVMVASGLKDRPSVSHFNLAVHLVLAFTLLGIALWTALSQRAAAREGPGGRGPWNRSSRVAAAFVAVLGVQVLYGGFTAGLKAGHVSDTWPLMFGRLLPAGLFSSVTDLFEAPATIVFIHRWFAFAVAAAALWLAAVILRDRRSDAEARLAVWALLSAIGAQIVLGVLTVLTGVNPAIALAHQATAIAVFSGGIAVLHRLRLLDVADSEVGIRLPEGAGGGRLDRTL